ncbi:hypothetical protein [Geodermatophilus normandii]|uniref:Uncharacterized protein n=1 Tax=Geodermatophilus normandii TaxID=1137989 RepID=A0A6P0GAY2_9ACTN|nr:hypothetical protein [Geodermatophilus normandii]NEM05173.1 hypothetical protein [Geodermatophilus normandii]
MRSTGEADDRRDLERLALEDWPERAGARVRSVTIAGNRAKVALAVNGNYDYWVYYQRDGGGWQETASSNGPTTEWEDRSVIAW